MTTTDRNIQELEKAGLFNKDSDYDGMIGNAVKALLLTFQKQGHSGYSAQLTAHLFYKLVKGEPLSPLTADASEWMEMGPENFFQSMRVANVFINKNLDPRPYTLDGKAFSDDGGQTYFTNKDSCVYFDLPGYPPETQYVILDKNGSN